MFNHDELIETFRKPLLSSPRGDAFVHATRILSRKPRAFVVELGSCGYQPDTKPFEHNGGATALWDWCVDNSGGDFGAVSVDQDETVLFCAEKEYRNVKCIQDSAVHWLEKNAESVARADLIYFDTWDEDDPAVSDLDVAAQLWAVWEFVQKGCILMFDDCERGQTLVKQYFQQLKLKPELAGFTSIWRKP